jgi:hypothetical protein
VSGVPVRRSARQDNQDDRYDEETAYDPEGDLTEEDEELEYEEGDADYEADEDEEGEAEYREESDTEGPEPVPPAVAAQAALRHVVELTGKQPSGVTSLEPTEEGWIVGIEVVEDHRIPSSIDLLGLYLAEIRSDGSLVSYRRVRRYPRGRSENSEVM